MIDTFVKVYKQKEDGNLLKGAQLTVVSTKTKNRIDQWITGQHIFDINDVMKKKILKGDMCQGKNEEGIEYKVFNVERWRRCDILLYRYSRR